MVFDDRMSVQALKGFCNDSKLCLSWLLMTDSEAISVQVAHDSEFTDTLRQFVIPFSSGCTLDVGHGIWFYRVATMANNKLEWSGINSPVFIDSKKLPATLKLPEFRVLHTQSIKGGVRFHTTCHTPFYTIVEYSKEPKFLASATKTRIFKDPGRGYIDCEGLDPKDTYSIRFTRPLANDLPKDTVHPLQDWIIVHNKRSSADTKPHGSVDMAERKIANRLLREANERTTPMRFASHSDHIKYLQAKANTRGKKETF